MVSVVNARHVRDFARATGRLAKTDQLDAAVLAAYGAAVHPAGTAALSAAQSQLAELVTRRQQVLALRVAEHNRLEHLTHPNARRPNFKTQPHGACWTPDDKLIKLITELKNEGRL